MALTLWGKDLWQICMHHWTVYAKVEFPKFPSDVRSGGSIPQCFDPELRNKLNFFPWGEILPTDFR